MQRAQKPNGTRRWVLGGVGVLGLVAGVWFWQSLLPETGQVIFEGLPNDAVVVVDGTPRSGNTFELAPGPHDFHVLAEGFVAVPETFQVDAGAIIRTPFTGRRIVLTTGTVVVEGLPNGGIVFADGDPQSGPTFDLPSGPHVIRMSAAGFPTLDRTIDVAAGEGTVVQYDGTAVVQGPAVGPDSTTPGPDRVVVPPPVVEPGLLQMRITPVAYVWLDGDSLGDMNRLELNMTPGMRHVLRFQREGFVTVDTTVILQPGETQQWSISLRRP